ncbi:MAG: hypothetical protein K2O34_14655 [Acetatifactor sp.]|nr:hypothetical protein [Acetatifactor sp.]
MYLYVYFKSFPEGGSLDELEDDLEKLLGENGEVTGSGVGASGGNIDIELFGKENILQDIESYLLSYGFDAETVLDVNGKRMLLGN